MPIDLNLAKNLDQDQLNAVLSTEKQLLCMANAGSGKTRMLTFRAANFIAQGHGFTQQNIMMLTFTKKAANEMRERIEKLLNTPYLKITAGTFHSIASKIIRQYSGYSMLPDNFSIFDVDATKTWMRSALTAYLEENPDLKRLPDRPTVDFIQKQYSHCRNTRTDFVSGFAKELDDPDDPRVEICTNVIMRYEAIKQSTPALDFDDLLEKFAEMLRYPAFRKIMQTRYPAIFVDEYQDINVIQHEIIKSLTGPNTYLTAVGDDAQCIYGFRGSNVHYILDFKKNFPNGKILYLPKNYRSSKQIVQTASDILNNSEYHMGEEKTMIAVRNDPCPDVKFISLHNETAQADYIQNQCQQAKARMLWSDMVVLVRTKSDANAVERALLNAKIPVSKECGLEFYEHEQIKVVIKYIQFLQNPNDKAALMAVMSKCPSVGQKTVNKMFDVLVANKHKLSAMESVRPYGKKENIYYDAIINSFKTAEDLISTGCDEPRLLASEFIDEFLIPWCKNIKYTDENAGQLQDRLSEIDQLIEQLDIYPDTQSFLENAVLDTSLESKSDNDKNDKDGKVRIMTIHKSKGLEFKKVFLISMSQGLSPSTRQIGNKKELAEELRVIYVAMTRAMDELDILSVRTSLRIRGNFNNPAQLKPSEFFDGISFTEIL